MEIAAIYKALTSYGVLGLVCAVQMFVIVKLYKDREAEREARRVAEEAFRDRLMTKAETWVEKYTELARSITTVLDSLQRKLDEQRARQPTDAQR